MNLARRVHLLGLVGVVALVVGSAGTGTAWAQNPPPPVGGGAVSITKVRFAYPSGDATPMYESLNTPVPVPEWDWIRSSTEPALYEEGRAIEIQASFVTIPGVVFSAEVWATGSFGGTEHKTIPFSIADGKSIPEFITFKVQQKLPNTVGVQTVAWDWQSDRLNGQPPAQPLPSGATTHEFLLARASKKSLEKRLASAAGQIPPAPDRVFEQVARWSVQWTANSGKDSDQILKDLLDNLPSSLIRYQFPDYVGTHGTKAEDVDSVLTNGFGTCGPISALFRSLADVQDVDTNFEAWSVALPGVKDPYAFPSTEQLLDPDVPGHLSRVRVTTDFQYFNFADSYRSRPLTALNNTLPKQWVFGNHCVISAQKTMYDPNFAPASQGQLLGDWKDYITYTAQEYGVMAPMSLHPFWFVNRSRYLPEETDFLREGTGFQNKQSLMLQFYVGKFRYVRLIDPD